MTKLYYNDGLRAAIMFRDHGVWLQTKGGRALRTIRAIIDYCNLGQKAYVHPDSYHIFKPEDGDMDIDGDILYDNPKQKIGESCISDGEGGFKKGIWCVSKDYKANIIRRNNTAFFMPKQEQEDD